MPRIKKKRILVPKPRSRFVVVVCPNCGYKQIVFDHATFPVTCSSCGTRLVKTTGGKAKILGAIERVLG